ncbi:RNA polymerase sigma factor [Aureibacter tunicatorum]|uniref:RNA polymerase sigma factor (Sigma-70 family) n=1 Tax=Aureibacter tunicatorum TaxID=866807 RepID=A0AAE3XR55_9BACT|nr:RNA polymerase sigma factor [Aureibacter tunicatorum]MDR6240533.1 RNA polymerase sigma factor (sigma-70 family) [Aureibacter tunicatorum]BDD06606.1 hypothetical protein AUTU_40890 [Aureibacter tunicatorum]
MFFKRGKRDRLSYTDQQIIDAVLGRENIDKQIRFIYQEHFQVLKNMILRNGGAKEEAEDVFQESVIILIDSIKSGKFKGKSSLKSFLYGIGRNLWLVSLKEKSRFIVKDVEEDDQIYEMNWNDIVQVNNEENILNKLFNTIGEPCHSLLIAYYYEGLNITELQRKYSDTLANEQVVRNKKSRCLKTLRKRMEDRPEVEGIFRDRLVDITESHVE